MLFFGKNSKSSIRSSKELALDEGRDLYKASFESLQQRLEHTEPSNELKRFLFKELSEACKAGKSRKIVDLVGLKSNIFKEKINQQIGYSWHNQYCLTALIVKLLRDHAKFETIDKSAIEALVQAGADVIKEKCLIHII